MPTSYPLSSSGAAEFAFLGFLPKLHVDVGGTQPARRRAAVDDWD
ncbi:hypothetical protein PLANPX_1682 [Lacipirellula parvula]|uniref:Uncharacterized protein n=1 Tax=Lacipirellula parvula TaxID=2650471 RepID=A0A5K7X680_9BACT|nr:hypothetical protein PLANPX_1682 [Lacipirellula parvula]